ncbi:MAG TPA: DapH/DapD/GlmU-related protein [Solirubrobacteraceae bacterium]
MNSRQLQRLKLWAGRLWLLGPERLWLLSIGLQRRGHWVLAFALKQLNTLINHNSLGPGASVSPDIRLGHSSLGIVITSNVEIGKRVKIWQNVTLSAGRPARRRAGGDASPAERDTAALADAGAAANGADQRRSEGPRSRIVIEDDVTIGANAVVIAPRGGVLRIGRGARVGAGTVITEDVPPRSTVVGQPARVLPRGSALGEPA